MRSHEESPIKLIPQTIINNDESSIILPDIKESE
jgi:hypothetical protein